MFIDNIYMATFRQKPFQFIDMYDLWFIGCVSIRSIAFFNNVFNIWV